MKKIRLSETELINLIKRVVNEKRGSTTDRERTVSKKYETPCDYVEDCDFENTGTYWDPDECECVPLIV